MTETDPHCWKLSWFKGPPQGGQKLGKGAEWEKISKILSITEGANIISEAHWLCPWVKVKIHLDALLWCFYYLNVFIVDVSKHA